MQILGYALVALMGLAMLAATVWAARAVLKKNDHQQLAESQWVDLAARLGLDYRGPKATTTGIQDRVFRGVLEGRAVSLVVSVRPRVQDWTLRLELLREGLPQELTLSGPWLAPLGVEAMRLRPGKLDSRDLTLQRLAQHPGPFLGSVLQLRGSQLQMELSSVGPEAASATLEAALLLMRQLEAASDQAWLEAGQRLGLHAGLVVEGAPSELSGELEGVSVRARFVLHPAHTEVVARWKNPRIADLEVALPEALPEQPKLDLPVLDMLVAVRCRDPEAAREILGRAEVTEALLELVHGEAGSRVLPGQVRLWREGEPGEQSEALIRKAARLARLLSG